MRSEEKIDVTVTTTKSGKRWVKVKVKFDSGAFLPSFHDLFRIIQAILYCERLKYAGLSGTAKMVRDFLIDCCQEGVEWETLRQKYKLPEE